MNIVVDGKLRLTQFRYDGSNPQVLRPDILGSGHPSYHIDGRWMVTDVYTSEKEFVLPSGEVPIRRIDMQSKYEGHLCEIWTLGGGRGVGRCDPHLAWELRLQEDLVQWRA